MGDFPSTDNAQRLIDDRFWKLRTMRWFGTGHDAIPFTRTSRTQNPMERIIHFHPESTQPYNDL
jgi:hypothetical protein